MTLVKRGLIISVKLLMQRFYYTRLNKYYFIYPNGKEQFYGIPHMMLFFRNTILNMDVYKNNSFLHLSLDFLSLDRESERRLKHICRILWIYHLPSFDLPSNPLSKSVWQNGDSKPCLPFCHMTSQTNVGESENPGKELKKVFSHTKVMLTRN